MPATTYCHKFFSNTLSSFNQARMKALLSCSDALVRSDCLTLTQIGRHMSGKAKVKNKIKRVDRLLANKKMQAELPKLYQAIASTITAPLSELYVAVDWSGCCGSDYHVIRASLQVEGRSIVLYSMIVEAKDADSPQSNEAFLKQLHKILGNEKPVYIVSDGGFLTPWYFQVLALEWHFIGRLRGTMKCQLDGQNEWQTLNELRKGATQQPKALGEATLTKGSPTACQSYLHLYKGEARCRKGKSRFTKDDKMYRNLAKEPWLIATSDSSLCAKQVMDIYAGRMQIEQNFRDDKSPKYGFSWRFSKTAGIERMSVLCLIASIAGTVLWFIGFEAERRKWHLKYQANTVKSRRVLSFLTLAKNVILHEHRKLTAKFLRKCRLNFETFYEKDCVY